MKPSREEMLLVMQALDETGGCLRFRVVMGTQGDDVVRREYRDAVGGVVRWEEGPGDVPCRRGVAESRLGRRKGLRKLKDRRRAYRSGPDVGVVRLPG